MKAMMKPGALALVACAAANALPLQCAETAYPSRPIRIVVPYLAGGGVDTAARVVGQKMGEALGQSVLIENKPGAATNIGSDHVAKSQPDGYTLLLANSSQVANVSIYGSKMPYDFRKELGPVTLIGTTPLLLVVHPSLPVRTAKDLIALAKSRPGQLTYASAGIGSPTHIAPELFKWMAGLDMLHVPYKGGSQVVTDVIGGQITMYFAAMSTGLPLVKAGRLRALGVTGPKPFPAAAPGVPAIAETGLPGYELVGFFAILCPSGTPQDVVAKLNAAAVKVLSVPEMKARLVTEGIEAVGSSPQELDAFLRKELAKHEKLVRAANIRPE
jgi:tripartite-type tricarboxylate transporter receptor subunit TctC